MAETDAQTQAREEEETSLGKAARQAALDHLQLVHREAARVLGREATRTTRISGPDGVVMTPREMAEDAQLRRDDGGRTDEDRDFSRI